MVNVSSFLMMNQTVHSWFMCLLLQPIEVIHYEWCNTSLNGQRGSIGLWFDCCFMVHIGHGLIVIQTITFLGH